MLAVTLDQQQTRHKLVSGTSLGFGSAICVGVGWVRKQVLDAIHFSSRLSAKVFCCFHKALDLLEAFGIGHPFTLTKLVERNLCFNHALFLAGRRGLGAHASSDWGQQGHGIRVIVGLFPRVVGFHTIMQCLQALSEDEGEQLFHVGFSALDLLAAFLHPLLAAFKCNNVIRVCRPRRWECAWQGEIHHAEAELAGVLLFSGKTLSKFLVSAGEKVLASTWWADVAHASCQFFAFSFEPAWCPAIAGSSSSVVPAPPSPASGISTSPPS